jgi:hypothetical protein
MCPTEQEQKGRLERLEKERNNRDAVEHELRKVANQRLGWLSSYQSVAKVRMESQQEQLAPLLVAAKQSKAELQEAEELQVCPVLSKLFQSLLSGLNAIH